MKNINNDAPLKYCKTILINSSPEKIWAIITNIDQWSRWETDIKNPKINGQLIPSTTFDFKINRLKIHSNIHTVEPFHHFGWTAKIFGMHVIHNMTLTETKGQTMVSDDESLEGFLVLLFKKLFDKKLEKNKQNWLEQLKKECEKSAN
ncbi:MAG: SRPBCC family protein [Nitrosotalea sp.]